MEDFLNILDHSSQEIQKILDLALCLKKNHFKKGNPPLFKDNIMETIFQDPGLRTMVSYDMALRINGGDIFNLFPWETGHGTREIIAEVARVPSEDARAIIAQNNRGGLMDTRQYIEIEERYGAHNYHPLDVVLTRGEGVWVYDVEGRKYLDCLSAYSALNQGHVHPKILAALQEQASKITLTSRAFRNDQLPLFYKELSELTGYEMSLPMNSGAEAVETAIKLARKWAYQVKRVPRHQAEIITCAGNFHGRTVTSYLILHRSFLPG